MFSFIASAAAPVLRAAARPPSPRVRSAFAGLAVLSVASISLSSGLRTRCEAAPRRAASGEAGVALATLADLPVIRDIDGGEIAPETFANKVVFAINVASACGYTDSGYGLLKRLTDKYPPADFVAVVIPCNAFLWQESGTPDEIKTFALARVDKLVITERSEVNGNNAHPIMQLGKSAFPGRINWNFDGRFVFDRRGAPVAKFGNASSAEEIEAVIDKLI